MERTPTFILCQGIMNQVTSTTIDEADAKYMISRAKVEKVSLYAVTLEGDEEFICVADDPDAALRLARSASPTSRWDVVIAARHL